jgi:hypothetical protein
VHQLERLAIGLLHPVDQVFERRLQAAYGRAQLVRDVGDQLASHPVDLGELGGHRVERARELPDLVARRGCNAPLVVAACHRPAGGCHLAQRRGHPARQHLDHRKRERRRRQRTDHPRHAGAHPHRGRNRSHSDGRNDHHAELELDRRQPVEWPHGSPSPRA